ncbi:MAG: fimbrillin family protein [Prevotella sp.]|nr:fimbrillin family protein [Prevotella sp.]
MKQNKLFIGLAAIAAALTFTSCSSDEPEKEPQPEKARTISFTSTVSNSRTRATSDPQGGTSLATGQYVGIFGISSEETSTMTNYTNNKYVTAASNAINFAGTEGEEMTWPTTDAATASLYAYAPYQENWTVNAANTFSVKPDQSSDANYLASDLLYASAANQAQNTTVTLEFRHMLSKVDITIKKIAGSNVDLEGATVKIKNTKLKTSLTPSTGTLGTVTDDNEATDIIAATIASDLTAGDATSQATACAVIVPQELAANTAFIEITTSDDKTLIGKLSEAATFTSGESYSLTISVGKVTEPVTEVAISFGTTSLVGWGTTNSIGLTSYGIGDYVLSDGTFMKASAYATASATEKAKIVAIIFSTNVSATDATSYDAYAMGLATITAGWANTTYHNSTPSTFADALSDANGLSKISYMGTLTGTANTTGENMSVWFIPTFGELIQILNNLGNANITSETTVDFTKNQNGDIYSSETSTVLTSINSRVTAIGKSSIFSAENQIFVTCTENQQGDEESQYKNFFYLKVTASDATTFGLGKSAGKNNASRVGLPCIAVKLPSTTTE